MNFPVLQPTQSCSLIHLISSCVVPISNHSWGQALPTVLTPWSRVFPEKLIVTQLVKKVPSFYGTQRFITIVTRDCLRFLFWIRCNQSTPHPISPRCIVTSSSHLCLDLPCPIFPSSYLTELLYAFLISPKHATCPAHIICPDLSTLIVFDKVYKLLSPSFCSLL